MYSAAYGHPGSPVKHSSGVRTNWTPALVVMTTGSHHMQFYWRSSRNGRSVSVFPFAYLAEDERWVPRESVFLRPAAGMFSAEEGRWNTVCIQCHATHGRSRAARPGGPDTHVAEFGIACEACHGPAHEHVARNRLPHRRYDRHWREDAADETITNPPSTSPVTSRSLVR